VQAWGPVGSPCWGLTEWGKYGDDETKTFTELAYCTAKGETLDGMKLWGPIGEDCGGMSGEWGYYDSNPKPIDAFNLGSCKGKGGVQGLKQYGPEGEFCYGLPAWEQYK